MKVVWTRLALLDLGHAYDYVAEEAPAAATRLIERIEIAVGMLGRHPELGRPGRIPGTRELVVTGTPSVIPYRVRAGRVEVLAVLHGARIWPEAL